MQADVQFSVNGDLQQKHPATGPSGRPCCRCEWARFTPPLRMVNERDTALLAWGAAQVGKPCPPCRGTPAQSPAEAVLAKARAAIEQARRGR